MSTDEMSEFIDRLGTDQLNDRGAIAGVPLQGSCEKAPDRFDYNAGDLCQWLILSDGKFAPASATTPKIPPGVYQVEIPPNGPLMLCSKRIVTDELLRFPEAAMARVLIGIQKFWDSRDRFLRRGQIFKRGVLLWGDPGSGKTCTVNLLMQDLVERGGIVLLVDWPHGAIQGLEKIRRIEPTRPVICVMEDLDEIVRQHGEAQTLSLLDGESQTDNIVHIATTNYPSLLDKRFVNRPSRFDEVIKIGMPSAETRRIYLRSRLTVEELSDHEIARWIKDTDGMSIAHLRELVVAVHCLDREYAETLSRLKAMMRKPTEQARILGMTGAAD